MRAPSFIAALAFAALSLNAPKAVAAPQILAALPVSSGIEIACADGVCAAQLSTYCLQRERPAPSMGTAYVPASASHFTLVLQSDGGRDVHLPAGDHMRFVENRGFMAVAATLEHGRMIALGAKSAKLVVHENASLIPVAQPDDPNPLTEKEIAYVTDSLREHGKGYVDNRAEAASAQLLAQLNAALPEAGMMTNTTFEGTWHQAIGDEIPLPSGPALSRAEDAFNNCASRGKVRMNGGFKRCLEFHHDDFIRGLNIDYWENQPGS